MSDWVFGVVATLVKLAMMVGALMGGLSVMTWIERRLSGLIQFRWGPNRVGPMGLFQPIADGIKFLMQEDIMPVDAHKPTYVLAPALALIPALAAFAIIPFGPTVEWLGRRIPLVIIDLDGSLLFAFAATSLGVYGVVMAGWASRNKYSLMGGLRSSAQMISYELTLSLSVIGVLLVSGTLRPMAIVEQQAGWFWNWNAFAGGWQILGFLLLCPGGPARWRTTAGLSTPRDASPRAVGHSSGPRWKNRASPSNDEPVQHTSRYDGTASIAAPLARARRRTARRTEGRAMMGTAENGAGSERTAISRVIHDAIGWALTKDFDLLFSVVAHDEGFFIFHPDSASTITGFDAFKSFAERSWKTPAFRATRFEIRELRVHMAASGTVAWYS